MREGGTAHAPNSQRVVARALRQRLSALPGAAVGRVPHHERHSLAAAISAEGIIEATRTVAAAGAGVPKEATAGVLPAVAFEVPPDLVG